MSLERQALKLPNAKKVKMLTRLDRFSQNTHHILSNKQKTTVTVFWARNICGSWNLTALYQITQTSETASNTISQTVRRRHPNIQETLTSLQKTQFA